MNLARAESCLVRPACYLVDHHDSFPLGQVRLVNQDTSGDMAKVSIAFDKLPEIERGNILCAVHLSLFTDTCLCVYSFLDVLSQRTWTLECGGALARTT